MTKEEIIKHLHEALNSVDITFPYRYVLVEAIEALSRPSLPSELDEAAKKAYKEYDVKTAVKPKEHPVGFLFFDGFKAGAEWLAGQGVNLSHLIAWYIQSVDAHEPVWTKEHLEELVKDYILIPKN